MRKHLKGVKSYVSPKNGKTYNYHRASGLRILSEPMTAEYLAEFQAADARVRPPISGLPGTLKMVVALYLESHEFRGLKPATRQEYQRIANELYTIGEVVMRELTSADIVKIRDAKLKRRNLTVANKTLALLSVLFSYAIERGYANDNPVRHVRKIKRPNSMQRKNRPWKMEEIDAVLSRAHVSIRLPVLIARWTGLRQSDVLALRKADFDGKVIRCQTSKRDVFVVVPVSETLAAYLVANDAANSPTICNNSRGVTWTRDGFKTSLFKLIRRLEQEGIVEKWLTFHGLRHTMATQLSELGYDDRTIADMLGQKSEGMAAHYSRDANLINKLTPAISRLEELERNRRALSNYSEKVSN